MKICLDYGHGGKDSGAVCKGRKEADDVLKIGRAIKESLVKYGIQVDETRTDDRFLTLKERVELCNRKTYDFVISIHRNAYMYNVASGVEVYLNPTYQRESYDLAFDLVNNLSKLGFRNRGIKKNNFYILRNTKSKALLLELGFIDNDLDNYIYDSKYGEIVELISGAIAERLR